MADVITVDEAFEQINSNDPNDYSEVALYVGAINEWITDRVSDTTPGYVKLAALFFLDHLWSSQRGPSGTPLSAETIEVSGRGFAVPNRVLELLGPVLDDEHPAPQHSFPSAGGWPDPVET